MAMQSSIVEAIVTEIVPRIAAESDCMEATNVRLEDAALELKVIQAGEQILPG